MDAEIVRLVDRNQILELTGRYNRAFDDLDVDTWIGTFVDDGVLELDGRSWKGHSALRRLVEKVGYGMVHVTTDSEVMIDGDTATQLCSAILFRRSREGLPVQLVSTARYIDQLRRTDNGWRFVRRVAATDSPI